mmetsp:Transcript_91425/g.247109  ORF Transcript_91425/g.247109 Transcript_91425/m.247109 type:complete len:227 (-) Transcript_91425:29-709(-)
MSIFFKFGQRLRIESHRCKDSALMSKSPTINSSVCSPTSSERPTKAMPVLSEYPTSKNLSCSPLADKACKHSEFRKFRLARSSLTLAGTAPNMASISASFIQHWRRSREVKEALKRGTTMAAFKCVKPDRSKCPPDAPTGKLEAGSTQIRTGKTSLSLSSYRGRSPTAINTTSTVHPPTKAVEDRASPIGRIEPLKTNCGDSHPTIPFNLLTCSDKTYTGSVLRNS